ncbi:hypothetical protein ACWGR4_18195 [Embleya sp. NPDC055664]
MPAASVTGRPPGLEVPRDLAVGERCKDALAVQPPVEAVAQLGDLVDSGTAVALSSVAVPSTV